MQIIIHSPFKKGKVIIYSSLWLLRAKIIRRLGLGFFALAFIFVFVFIGILILNAQAVSEHKQAFSPSKIPLVITNFDLTIEKIDLRAVIIPKVDPDNKEKYSSALKKGLAHNKNSALPGQDEPIYIFGHSTNYAWFVEQLNALFFKLPDLAVKDEIKINFNGKDYLYKVFAKKTVSPDEVSFLKDYQGQEILILQTCWPPGTTWKRLLVLAKPK